jgi:DNA-binding protein H-NS
MSALLRQTSSNCFFLCALTLLKQRSDAGRPLRVKYRGPNSETWSGRGRLPKWLQTLEAEGRDREEFRTAQE